MVRFEPPLTPVVFVSRYKRFFADFTATDGSQVTAHCANTGRMTGLLHPGAQAWIRPQPPGRKLGFAWELVETPEGLACVNTARANQVLAAAPRETWLPGVEWKGREPRVGSHRFDLAYDRQGAPVYVEVKSVTWCERGRGAFPDAPSARATAHVELLASLASEGVETHLVWLSMHAGIRSIEPASYMDPAFAQACRHAQRCGVQFHAWATQIDPQGLSLGNPLPWTVEP